MSIEYWRACLDEILGDDGLSSERMAEIARDVDSAASMQSEACGYLNIPNPDRAEISRLEGALKKERDMVFCAPCKGTGRLRYNAGPWGVDTTCDTCRGAGKHL